MKGKKKNKPTKGARKNKPTQEVEIIPEKISKYEDHNMLERYKAWYFSRPTLPTGAALLFVKREYDQLEEQRLTRSPVCLEVCLFLKREIQRLEHKIEEEIEASVAAKPSMGNTKFEVHYRMLQEGVDYVINLGPFDWKLEFTLLEASMKKELGADEEKYEGWEGELVIKKSAGKRVIKEAKENLNSSEIFDPECTPLEDTENLGSSVKQVERILEMINKGKKKNKPTQEVEIIPKKISKHNLLEKELGAEVQKYEEGEGEQEDKKSAIKRKELGAEKQKDEGWEWDKEQEDKKSASTMAASSSTMVDKRWSLEEEVNMLINKTLQLSFPGLGEESMTVICNEEYGDYQCENVLSIWPKIKVGKKLKGPRSVGRKIKIQLEKRYDMIEGTPDVHSIGFVTFKLSGKWMAKSLFKMIRYGIDTWAPKLPVEKVIVEIPDYESSAWNSIVGTEADIIRSKFISDALFRMLEYSKVVVKSSNDEFRRDAISRIPDTCSCFSIENRDGDVVISLEVEGEPESLNFGKRDIQDIRDSLNILRYELRDERADWIVCLNPIRHQEFVEMCFAAAKHAGWIPTTKHHGLSFAGYRTYAEAGNLVNLLEKAITRCYSLVQKGKVAGYTAAQVFCCTLGYEYLKYPRMAECSFNVDEMFNDKGNTFLYMLNTKSQVLSVLANSGKDIKLNNVSEFMLEKVEVLEKDKGHALAFHLLMFTQVLEESCLSVLPHILCRYLHDLCQKFISYNSSCSCVLEVGSVAETGRLILCEATATIMDKCFNLLGITPVSTFGESLNEPLKLLLDLERRMGPTDIFMSRCDSVIPASARDPPNSRFEIIAIRPQITEDSKFKRGKLFGQILVKDIYGLLSDGWVPTLEPDSTFVSLFYGEWHDSLDVYNHGLVFLGNPNARHSIPLPTSRLVIDADLLVTTKNEDEFFHLQRTMIKVKVSDFWEKEGDGVCVRKSIGGKDWSAIMYCILLKDAVDTTLEVKFTGEDADPKVKAKILAYYGKEFPYSSDSIVKRDFIASLLEPDSRITAGPLPLRRSKMAVPRNGSLVIEAELVDDKTGKVILKGRHEFFSEIKGISTHSIKWKRCSLDLKVNWNYQSSKNKPKQQKSGIKQVKGAASVLGISSSSSFKNGIDNSVGMSQENPFWNCELKEKENEKPTILMAESVVNEDSAKKAKKSPFSGFMKWKKSDDSEKDTVPLSLNDSVKGTYAHPKVGIDTKIKRKLHMDGSSSDFFVDKVLGDKIRKELMKSKAELQLSDDQIEVISTRLPIDKADLKKFFAKKWCDQYGETVLEVVRKEYKDHVNEIKNTSIAIKKEQKKPVEEKWTTFDDVNMSSSMKEQKKTVEQRWTTFDDDDENCHPNLFADRALVSSGFVSQKDDRSVRASKNRSSTDRTTLSLITIKKEQKKPVEEKWTTFDDVNMSSSMKKEQKKTVEQRWTTFDDDDENCHPNLFADRAPVSSGFVSQKDDRSVRASKNRSSTGRTTLSLITS